MTINSNHDNTTENKTKKNMIYDNEQLIFILSAILETSNKLLK
jgi:hypothetical protein